MRGTACRDNRKVTDVDVNGAIKLTFLCRIVVTNRGILWRKDCCRFLASLSETVDTSTVKFRNHILYVHRDYCPGRGAKE